MGNTMMANGIINRSLLLTVAPMGASWLNALAMVVSEMGAKKSPKVAHAKIAPASRGKSAPKSPPAG